MWCGSKICFIRPDVSIWPIVRRSEAVLMDPGPLEVARNPTNRG